MLALAACQQQMWICPHDLARMDSIARSTNRKEPMEDGQCLLWAIKPTSRHSLPPIETVDICERNRFDAHRSGVTFPIAVTCPIFGMEA